MTLNTCSCERVVPPAGFCLRPRPLDCSPISCPASCSCDAPPADSELGSCCRAPLPCSELCFDGSGGCKADSLGQSRRHLPRVSRAESWSLHDLCQAPDPCPRGRIARSPAQDTWYQGVCAPGACPRLLLSCCDSGSVRPSLGSMLTLPSRGPSSSDWTSCGFSRPAALLDSGVGAGVLTRCG